MNIISFPSEFLPQKRVILSGAGRLATGAVEGSALKIAALKGTGFSPYIEPNNHHRGF